MDGGRARSGLRVDATLAAAVDHVRLCYDYLDSGDIDGCLSLFEPGARSVVTGSSADLPERVERLLESGARAHHAVVEVFGSDRRLAAVGRLTVDGEAYDFVDVFRVSDRALLIDRQRFVSPGPPTGSPPPDGRIS
ncbi:hypothetical protein O7606_06165 [Micromonospora sp. WMMD882]|uniref:hypothetical protein n=1 Tax=Micromonospora sp. WMMD882 TaxID=3015151 RepID=UPI00248BB73A|nr:hypothetical protein [Micromonospora sp. WMMD882]WBB80966.1 hypothetical protein O7606_06165 [Micromonospora sp. WMMD882]